MPSATRATALALLLVAASCIGACGSSGGDQALDGPVMRYPEADASHDSMTAEVKGVLQLEGTCLYVSLDEVGERYPVLWPAGTEWDATERAVRPPSGPPLPIGSAVYGGGGYVMVDDIERLAGDEASARAAACVDNRYDEIAVVNNGDDAITAADE